MNVSDRISPFGTYGLAFDITPVPMLLVNGAGEIVLTNAKLERLLGYKPEALHNRPLELILPPEDLGAPYGNHARFVRVLNTQLENPECELFARHLDGRKFPVQIEQARVDTVQGEMTVCTLIDLTARNAALADARNRQKELETLNHDLSRFTYGASHDLKAPLASIIGLLTFCTEDLEDGALGELQENLTLALGLCQQSTTRIDAVFEVARVGQQTVPVGDVRLRSIVTQIWGQITRKTDITVDLQTEFEHPDPIRSEHSTLHVILENLISNAVRFRDVEKSRLAVTVGSQIQDGTLNVSVRDNGAGIPQDRHQDVFRMFRRIDGRSGNGLGLALSKRHAERLGGKIEFSSVEGEGSVFSVVLPYRTGAAE